MYSNAPLANSYISKCITRVWSHRSMETICVCIAQISARQHHKKVWLINPYRALVSAVGEIIGRFGWYKSSSVLRLSWECKRGVVVSCAGKLSHETSAGCNVLISLWWLSAFCHFWRLDFPCVWVVFHRKQPQHLKQFYQHINKTLIVFFCFLIINSILFINARCK